MISIIVRLFYNICHLSEIPKDISRVDRNTYMEALRSGTEVKKYVRIQVIGQDRVGKTSLVRRLLKCEHDGKSTDGIEIHRRYQMRTKGEGELFDCKGKVIFFF